MNSKVISAIENGNFTYIQGGSNDCYLIEINGRKILHKTIKIVPSAIKNNLRSIDKKIQNLINERIPTFMCRDSKQTLQEMMFKEIKTISLWENSGIKVPKILGNDESSLTYEYIPSKNIHDYLSKNKNDSIFEKTLELYHSIRHKAKTNNKDLDFLHSDCHLRNFLYNFEDENIIPIDPGLVLSSKLDFNQNDACLNLFFMYSTLTLDLEKDKVISYLQKISDSLSYKEKGEMLEINYTPPLGKYYLTLRERVAHKIRNRDKIDLRPEYDSKKVDLISNLLS